MDQKPSNPLTKHFRQPAIYLKLPSGGQFWDEDAIRLPMNGEIAIYPMTTRDEITLRTPDALMNGAGVVSVIQSCCPDIINAWRMPSIDVDAVIIAIRIASYGDVMTFNSRCPQCSEIHDYGLSLQQVLSRIRMPNYEELVDLDGLKIKLYPQAYFNLNEGNILQFEEQKLMQAIQNTDLPEEQRSVEIAKQVERIVTVNIKTLTSSTEYVQLDDGTQVADKEFLREFYTNCSGHVTKSVQEKLAKLNSEGAVKPMHVACESCSKEFDIQVTFDYASFFDNGF